MKSLLKLLSLAVIVGLSSCVVHRTVVVEQGPPPNNYAAPAQAPAPEVAPTPAPTAAAPVGYDEFYNQLSPYGNWVNYQSYGYVWVPNAGPSFMPYSTGGHWVYTDYGWTWASDYSWGWAPFHYGRWISDAYYGWMWVPGNTWGPAWVTWRSCNGYYGWAPMTYGNVDYYNPYYSSGRNWVFCDRRYINSSNPQQYYAPREGYDGYIRNSTVISNTYAGQGGVNYYSGPKREEVETYTGSPVNQYHVGTSSAPGQSYSGNTYQMYRPNVTNVNAGNRQVAPSHVASMNEITPIAQRQEATTPQRMEEHPAQYNGNNNNNNNQRQAQPQQNQNERQSQSNTNNNSMMEQRQAQPQQNEQRQAPPQQTQNERQAQPQQNTQRQAQPQQNPSQAHMVQSKTKPQKQNNATKKSNSSYSAPSNQKK